MRTIELQDLNDRIDDFLRNDNQSVFAIGELIGCNLLRYVSEAVLHDFKFEQILFVSGIQDDVYNGKIFRNHVYWASLFDDIAIDGVIEYDPFKPKIQNPDPEYWKTLSKYMLGPFHVMIIHNAHKIPRPYLNTLVNEFKGKTIMIVDPFDRGGEDWSYVETCVDTFDRVSKVVAFARFLYGYDTRSINKKLRDSITYDTPISRRSIGKLDDKQYVTVDPFLYDTITEKQLRVSFRKNQKIMIVSDKINLRHDSEFVIPHALTYGTLLNIIGVQANTPRFRIYASKVCLTVPIAYNIDFRTPKNVIRVAPANILTLDDAIRHRHRNIVFVTTPTCPSMSLRDQYSLMKIGQNITFATMKR